MQILNNNHNNYNTILVDTYSSVNDIVKTNRMKQELLVCVRIIDCMKMTKSLHAFYGIATISNTSKCTIIELYVVCEYLHR